MADRTREYTDGPEVLREFLPALRHVDRLAREELARLRARAEAEEFAVLRRSHQEIRELRELIRTGRPPGERV